MPFAIFVPLLAPYDHLQTDLSLSLKTSSVAHWFGTDEFGRDILPNVLAPLIVQVSLGMSTSILEAASLGFLGLGVQPSQAEWGDMIAHGRQFINNASYMIYFPGIAISLTVLGLNLFGDGLRDILNPRLKK